MSKSSVASAPKLPTPLSQKSAWARGPPISSTAPTPRSQSPAQASGSQPSTASHSRRPSTLSQAPVSFKDGVAGARSPVGATKSGSSVTFGSIDDDAAPISSSPASVPPIKPEAPKAFGSVTATTTSVPAVNGKPPASSSPSVSSTAKPSSSTPSSATHPRFDVKKLFQGASSGPSPSQSPSDSVSSPSTRTSSLPQHSAPQASSSHTPQSAQFGSHSFTPFVPAGGLRPQPNGTGGNGPPRSPVYPRQVPNGTAPPVNGRPAGGPGTSAAPPTPMSAGMPSPRLGPPHPGQQPGMPPAQPVAWNPYTGYYGYAPPEWYPQPWMQHMPPQHQPPHTPGGMQGPPHQPPHQHQHQQGGMPMSPRHPPSTLHTPGTPTMSPAVSAPISTPSPHMHTSSLSTVTSPPSTPASAGPSLAGGLMDRNAKPFVPRKVIIKNEAGQELNVEAFKKHGPSNSISGYQSPIAVVPGSPARKVVRMETEEAKKERLAEEQRVKEEKEKAERARQEELERVKREEEERIRKLKEDAERAQKAKEEEERRKKEEEEKERVRKIEEEKERARKELEKERLRLEEEVKERLRKEAEENAKKEAEMQERLRKEAEEKAKAEAEAEAAASAAATKAAAETSKVEEPEEGEVEDGAKDEAKDKTHDKPPLRLDTAVAGPTEPKKRPGPLDLSGTKGPIAPPLPSALATARIIDDLGRIDYPEGIKSPKVELNINAKQGKFRYDRDFLLQFMALCKDKPDNLPPLDAIGLEPSDQNFPISRGGSGRRQSSASGMGPPSSTQPRQASIGLGLSGFGKPGSGGFNMGQFATAGNKMSSEERFAMANRSSSMSGGPPGMPFGRPSPMVRSSSQGGPGGVPMGSNRTRSQRGNKRGDKGPPPSQQQSSFSYNSNGQQVFSNEPVVPLEVSANRWTPASVAKKPQVIPEDSPEMVDRKVKGLLNKLTMERFDSISDQIIAWANKSEKEKDGRTLIQVIRLVFEKATDEAGFSEMYARLCRKMMEQISPKVQDDGIKNTEGKHITGGHLFRKYLLNRCQEDFERGWASKESTAAAAASKASEDQAAANAAAGDEETALYSEEYYAAAKAKRQGLGLIKFIGELFKLQMLTERIMHECVKKLLGNVENPEEEEIESLCKLLSTVGALLDTPKARAHMDVYFSRMKELTKSPNVNSRMQFMLQDVLELRERKWIPRNLAAAPTTIAAVHEAAAKEKASQEKDSYNRNLSMSRGGSRRGGERGDHTQVGPDGWAVAGNAAPRPPPKAGDLSNFGKINKTTSMTFGPSSVFAAGKTEKKRESATISRTGSVNMFSMLSQNPELANEVQAQSKSSRPPSRKPSIDLGPGGVPEQATPQRRKLNLLPRSIPKEDSPAASTAVSEDEGADASAPSMTEKEAKTQVDEDCKEFFNVRDINEAETYFTKLPTEHRHILVDKLVSKAIDGKQADSDLVANLFTRAAKDNWCSPEVFEQGFTPIAEMLDDIVIDVPKAIPLFATMLKAANLDEERSARLASKSEASDKLLGLLTA